jgi:hypothetical protein
VTDPRPRLFAGKHRLVAVASEASGQPGCEVPLVGCQACGPSRATVRLGLAGTADRRAVVCDPPGVGACVHPSSVRVTPSTSQHRRLSRWVATLYL